MSGLKIHSIADITTYPHIPKAMSENWEDGWFTEDLTPYSNILSTTNVQPLNLQGTTSTQPAIAGLTVTNYGSRYPYEYGQPFNLSQVTNSSGRISDLPINNAPAMHHPNKQPNTQLMHSSSRFESSISSNRQRGQMDKPQPSIPMATGGFLPMLPSQQMHSNPATSGGLTESVQSQLPKRVRAEAESGNFARSPKRRTSANMGQSLIQNQTESANQLADLSDEERLLFQLKQEQNLPWKEIAKEFERRMGKPFQVPALQMRYKRLRERLRSWTDEDVAALEAAHEYWQTNKFEIIASKACSRAIHFKMLKGNKSDSFLIQMLDYGLQDRWPARYCEKKWEELHPEPPSRSTERTGIQQRMSLRPSLPEGQNYSTEWPMPSPPRDLEDDVATTAPLPYPTTSTTLPRNPILPKGATARPPQEEPT